MRLALLLVVAALDTAVLADASDAVVADGARPGRGFRVAPLQLGPPPVRPFQLAVPDRLPRVRDPSSPPQTQLTNRRTRVSCTMRVVRLGPSMDPGILGGESRVGSDPDPIVRNEVAPCVE
jgi:hypothetical protein